MSEYPHSELTGEIIGAAMEVHNALGPGFLESIYEEALAKELKRRGIPFSRQVEVEIHYKGDMVGTHVLDLVVANAVVVELKAVKELADIHKAIVLSYLAATGLPVALLLNFSQRRLDHKRLARTIS
ncbi:MAG TPA: GxxExxY protein [Symbiobacteriaceae bacterium]|nr:GxxExxY protein [Symbiobacteriaceae bacterium]